MAKHSLLATLAVSGLALASTARAADSASLSDNPFAQPSTLAYQLPPFDRIKDADFAPAFKAGMAEQRKEVDAIAHNPSPATFENTIVALERSGALLTRVSKAFDNLNASNTDPEMQKVDSEMSPLRAAHSDAIFLDAALFARVDELWENRNSLRLDPESLQLLDQYHKHFLRAGAKLSDADKTALKQINERLSTLTTQFGQNILKATKDGAVVIDKVEDLDGFSPEQIGAAAEAAKARAAALTASSDEKEKAFASKYEGKWLISLQNTTIQPALEHLKNRAVRERIYRASIGRAASGEADNTALCAEVIQLRGKMAALLGYPTFAAYSVEDEAAATPDAVNKMLGQLGPAALAKAKVEAGEIQKLIDSQAAAAHTPTFKLEAWDWAFYAAQVRKARFDFDDAQVKPYFELNRVLTDGLFYAAHELYGLNFKERTDLPVYQPDVRVFEVFEADGTPLALLLRDDFKRDNKNGGAWMDNYVDQTGLLGTKPVIVNNLNIVKPAPGEPVLMSFDEVTTMFHEFGHALHGMFSDVKYPMIAGTNTPRDFVEFPSQFNEMWAREPQVLAHFARHYQTGEAMPKELRDKVLASQTYGEGYATTELLEAAMIDQSWHQLSKEQLAAVTGASMMTFEASALKKAGMSYGPVPPRYHSLYFSHIFAGSLGYAAAYYAYTWSEVLARDSGHWFHTHGGMTRANGDYFRAKILSRGRTKEPGILFEEFYGQPPNIEPLLEYRGLALPKPKS